MDLSQRCLLAGASHVEQLPLLYTRSNLVETCFSCLDRSNMVSYTLCAFWESRCRLVKKIYL
jgi:hypothetical protein